jgi:hypothetical protein
VGMGDQNQINRRQIAYLQPRLPQALQDEKPARKIGIDENILLADLEKKAGVADESHAHLAVAGKPRLMSMPGSRSDDGVAHQAAELPGTLAKRGILQGILQHRRQDRRRSRS